MAFRTTAIENFIKDEGYSADDIAAIKQRAKEAAAIYEAGGIVFSGGMIEHVLGSAARVKAYMEKRETNLERYA